MRCSWVLVLVELGQACMGVGQEFLSLQVLIRDECNWLGSLLLKPTEVLCFVAGKVCGIHSQ